MEHRLDPTQPITDPLPASYFRDLWHEQASRYQESTAETRRRALDSYTPRYTGPLGNRYHNMRGGR